MAVVAARWKWTKSKRKALDLFIQGASQVLIAKTIGKHRNTIRNWLSTPEFNLELQSRLLEVKTRSKLRRVQATTNFRDRVATMTSKALNKLEADPSDTQALRTFKELIQEYRACAQDERIEMGEADKRSSRFDDEPVNGFGTPIKPKQEEALLVSSFKEALLSAARNKTIDVEAMMMASDGDPQALIKTAMQQLLANNEGALRVLHANEGK